jgi:hypothetical protein
MPTSWQEIAATYLTVPQQSHCTGWNARERLLAHDDLDIAATAVVEGQHGDSLTGLSG